MHLYDERTRNSYIVWHNDPRLAAAVAHLIETTKPARWIETGTHLGWTSMWVARNFSKLPIYTVEIDPDFYRRACANLAAFPQVRVRQGDSVAFLQELLPVIRAEGGVSAFWLDAHWWPPIPLQAECRVVAQLDKYVCLVDDFACHAPEFEGDVYDAVPIDLPYVAEALNQRRCWRPDYRTASGYKGYGLFVKGVDYTPPPFLKEDVLP